jgi:hypothetical protein
VMGGRQSERPHLRSPRTKTIQDEITAMVDHAEAEDDTSHDSCRLEGADADFGFGRTPNWHRGSGGIVDPFVGAVLGDVLLERLIGEGGMGRVYLGRQTRPNRWVAVKVLKPGIFSEATLRRFERESDVLGRLHHPGITQVHAFGTFSVGGVETAYCVLEYVAGAQAITAYADVHGLTLRQRLIMFRDVCDAVIYAHSRGILHRDLKPGNILVSAEGQPKIIDFGIAHQLDHDTFFSTADGELGGLIGTMPYMAPEQFRGDRTRLDVRVDVYSLGVVLYELLSGRSPFELRMKSLVEAARAVIEDEPASLQMPTGTLEGTVEVIVRKCLEKSPQDRYASVVELGADVDRSLRREPLSVRPPTASARLRRFVRRHDTAMTFLAGWAASLMIVGAAVAAWRWLDPIASPAPATDTHAVLVNPPPDPTQAKVLDEADILPLEPTNGWLTIECRALTVAAAEAAASKQGRLTIQIESIDADVARALAQRHDHLTIAGPMSISGEIAAALGSYRGQVLVLDSLEEISPTVAASLAGIPGWLNLNGIRRWKAGALEAIAGHEGGMCLRVPDMTVEQAALLGKHHGFLYLTGITHLDVARARELVKHELGLDLTEARGITPQAAALLRSRPKTIRFIDTD